MQRVLNHKLAFRHEVDDITLQPIKYDMSTLWKEAKLGEVTDILMGQSPPGDTYNIEGSGTPLINGPTEYGYFYPKPIQWTTKPERVCKVGDILFCVRGNTTGRMNIADQEYCVGRGVAAIHGKLGISDTMFINYLLEYLRPLIYQFAISGGSTFPNISRFHLNDLFIHLPPLPQQRAIAQVLRTVQEAIQTRRDELELELERKAAFMEYLFTHGTRGEPIKQTEIGKIPESWKIGNLREVIQGAPQNGAFVKQPELGKGTLYVNVYDIYQGSTINFKNIERMRCEPSFIERYALNENDILFVRSSLKREGIGQCCLVSKMEEPAIFDCHLIKVSPNTAAVEPLYLTYFFLSELGRSELIARSKTTTMTTINQNTLIDSLVPIPSIAEQREIIQVLEACDNKIAAVEQEMSLMEELFSALLEELMTGRLSTLPLIEEGENHE